ncbi:MAG: sulfatase-like hydrolase/transferase, partial [Oscillospiraceae bacterium]|nr:sulfatase-like hydrolase/transferase [Oscillospiraceae bacterium]
PEMKERTKTVLTLVGFFLSTFSLTVLILWIGTLNFSFSRLFYYFSKPLLVVLNYVPVMLLTLLLYWIFNRLWAAFFLTGAVSFLMAFVNHFKVLFRAEPFVALDLTTLVEGANAGGEFQYRFPKAFWIGILCILLGTVILGRYCRAQIPRKRWWIRLVAFLLCLGSVPMLWNTWYSDEALYHSYLYNDYTGFNVWKEPESASKRGIIYSFVYSVTDLMVQSPPNYDPKMAEGILAQYETEPIPADRRINVQIHMLESFGDLSRLGLSFTQDPYESWHALEEESYHGTLVVDVGGGGTVVSERSVMTGFTFPHPSYSSQTNSYARYFRSNGYFTQMTHPGDSWFYNREAVNKRLGFESGLYTQNYYKQFPGVHHGKDEELFPLIRDLYVENTKEGQPYFGFHVTYQNHSPYEDTCLLGEEYVSREGISDTAYYIMNNYLSGVRRTADQVAAYVDLYREDSQPVVLVFFGDHKAVLGDSNAAYEELGLDIGGGSFESCFNTFSTPYVIWANDAARTLMAEEPLGEGRVISPCYLMNEIFDLCGWKGDSWLQYQAMVRESLPVIHKCRTYYVDGVLTKELSTEVNDLRLQRNRVEFYWRYNLSE